MKVLVTGVGGQLGYDVMRELHRQGIDCCGADRAEFDITEDDIVDAIDSIEDFDTSAAVDQFAEMNKPDQKKIVQTLKKLFASDGINRTETQFVSALQQIVDAVSEKLGTPVKFCPDCQKAQDMVASMKAGDVLVVRPKSQKSEYFKNLDENTGKPDVTASWLKANRKKFEISITGVPSREEAEPDINEQLIVEYYSR